MFIFISSNDTRANKRIEASSCLSIFAAYCHIVMVSLRVSHTVCFAYMRTHVILWWFEFDRGKSKSRPRETSFDRIVCVLRSKRDLNFNSLSSKTWHHTVNSRKETHIYTQAACALRIEPRCHPNQAQNTWDKHNDQDNTIYSTGRPAGNPRNNLAIRSDHHRIQRKCEFIAFAGGAYIYSP